MDGLSISLYDAANSTTAIAQTNGNNVKVQVTIEDKYGNESVAYEEKVNFDIDKPSTPAGGANIKLTSSISDSNLANDAYINQEEGKAGVSIFGENGSVEANSKVILKITDDTAPTAQVLNLEMTADANGAYRFDNIILEGTKNGTSFKYKGPLDLEIKSKDAAGNTSSVKQNNSIRHNPTATVQQQTGGVDNIKLRAIIILRTKMCQWWVYNYRTKWHICKWCKSSNNINR